MSHCCIARIDSTMMLRCGLRSILLCHLRRPAATSIAHQTVALRCCRRFSDDTSTFFGGLDESTLFALSTPPGKSALAVVRLSGPACADVARRLCARPDRLLSKPRQVSLQRIVDPVTGTTIDEGVVIYFAGPASFTGQDCLEFHVHGGRATTKALLAALGRLPQLRPAAPGEFARRAFFAGKLDLSAVEGLSDLINADTDAQRRQALRQLGGESARLFASWRASLTRALAFTEARIDFGDTEDDAGDATLDAARSLAQTVAHEIASHVASATGSRAVELREGLPVALIGAPNAGKSSLLNALAARDVAIVSPVPGTTRDVLEVRLDVRGLPVLLTDTAGLRDDVDAADAVEVEGIRRARGAASRAALRLLVIDASDVAWPLQPAVLAAVREALTALQPPAPAPAAAPVAALQSEADPVLHYVPAEDVTAQPTKVPSVLLVFNKMDEVQSAAADAAADVEPAAAASRRTSDPLAPGAIRAAGFKRAEAAVLARARRVPELAALIDAVQAQAKQAAQAEGGFDLRQSQTEQSAAAATARLRIGGRSGAGIHFVSCATSVSISSGVDGKGTNSSDETADDGIAGLLEAVGERLAPQVAESAVFVRARHVHHAALCLAHLRAFLAARPQELDAAAEEIRAAVREVGRLTGTVGVEEMLDSLFSDLCIGK